MAGKRLPIEVVEARGNKHLTKAEIAERREQEVRAEVPKQIRSPDYLPQSLRKEFLTIGKQLAALGLFGKTDYDTLARYLIARQFWLQATNEVTRAMQAGPVVEERRGGEVRRRRTADLDAVETWTGIQNKYFQQCRACASDLGMTITSRCQLVVPKAQEPEANPFEQLLRRRQA